MKYYICLLFTFCLCQLKINAQSYTSDDVRILPVEIRWNYVTSNTYTVNFARYHSLHNEIIFQINTDGIASQFLVTWFDPGDGSGFQAVTPSDKDVQIVYPLLGANTDYSLIFELRDANSTVWGTVHRIVTIKANSSFSSAGYSSPDEVWDISSTATFTPPVAGSFPAGSPYNNNLLSGASAYIKYAPGHNGKLLKPLIFVDGIDFDAGEYTFNGEVVRHGSTGWDVFLMGNDASESADKIVYQP